MINNTELNLNSKRLIKYFVFFIAFPIFNFGISLSTFIFIFLIVINLNNNSVLPLNINQKNIKFWFFFLIGFISIVLAPKIGRNTGLAKDIVTVFQIFLWIIIAMFFMQNMGKINFLRLSKTIFFGLFLTVIYFYFINNYVRFLFSNFYIPRNTFVYIILLLYPISTYYFIYRFGKYKFILLVFVSLLLMLFSEGRAGFIIIVIENIMLLIIYFRDKLKKLVFVTFMLIPFILISSNKIAEIDINSYIFKIIEPISPRIASIIYYSNNRDNLTNDKSWMTRKLMIEKGIEIFKKYPVFGIGLMNFTSYDADFNDLDNSKYSGLYIDSYGIDYFNKKSSHNSYIMILSEMGLIGFISFLFIILPIVFRILFKIFTLSFEIKDLPLISATGMLIYFYAIASLPSSLTWFVFGLSYANYYNKIKI